MAEISGPQLDRVLPAHLNCIASAINDLGLEDTAKWIKYAGNDLCVLNNLPNNIWRKYEPSVQSVKTLLWLSNLPKPYRAVAPELQPDTASWLRENLDHQRQGSIFRKVTCVADIEDAVAQLKNLPPIEDIRPGFLGIWNETLESKMNFKGAQISNMQGIDREIEWLVKGRGKRVTILEFLAERGAILDKKTEKDIRAITGSKRLLSLTEVPRP